MTGKCKYCGNEYKNVGAHERHCLQNTDKQKREPMNPPKEEVQQPEKKPIIITDVQQYVADDYNDGLVAWFDLGEGQRIYRNPVLSGIMCDGLEKIPVVLMPTQDGMILPPFMFHGFIGMFPRTQAFPEPQQEEQPKEQEPITASIELIKSQQANDISAGKVIITPPEPAKAEKISFVDTILGKKKKQPLPTEVSKETTDLLKQLSNANRT